MRGIERVVAAILLAGAVAGAAAFAFMVGHTPDVTTPLGIPGRGAPGAVVIAPLPGLGVQAAVAEPASKPGVPIPVLVTGAKPVRIPRLVPVPRLVPTPTPAPRTKTPTPSPTPAPTPTPTPSPTPTQPVPTPPAPSAPTPSAPAPPATPVDPTPPPAVPPVVPRPPVEVGGRELTPLPPTAVTMVPVVPTRPVAPAPPPTPAPPALPITGTPSDGTNG